MVILIGGASCTGKTLLAQKLMEAAHIPYYSMDHLKMGWIRGDAQCGFTATDPKERIDEKLWPILRGIIMTAIENRQNLILEGCYLPAAQVQMLPPSYAQQTLVLYLGLSDAYLERHYTDGLLAHANAIEMRGYDAPSLPWLICANRKVRDECQNYGLPYFEVTEDYEREMQEVLNWMLLKLSVLAAAKN